MNVDGNDTEIWTMNADGTGRNNLTQEIDAFEYSPSFSPDGTKIVYFRDPKKGFPTPEIYMMNADGSNKHNARRLITLPEQLHSQSHTPTLMILQPVQTNT